jgi:hypothetical protein
VAEVVKSAGIHVSPDALLAFAGAVRDHVDGTIAPHRGPARTAFAAGAEFGQVNPSRDLQAMIAKYQQCLVAMNEQLTAYLQATDTLIDAASQVATNYRASDARAAATLDDALNAAMAVVYTPPQTGGGSLERPI